MHHSEPWVADPTPFEWAAAQDQDQSEYHEANERDMRYEQNVGTKTENRTVTHVGFAKTVFGASKDIEFAAAANRFGSKPRCGPAVSARRLFLCFP